jgi:hypothetical protein
VPADQAAGLRRLRRAQAPICITCFLDRAASTQALLRALSVLGKRILLVDMDGRHLAATRTRSLFDWRQQLQRRQLQGLPLPHGEGLYAPGAQGGDAEILEAAHAYDCVVFDAGMLSSSPSLATGRKQTLVLQVDATADSLALGYALLKTLHASDDASDVLLYGAASACTRLSQAARHFLGDAMARRIWAAAEEDEHFAALAARIAAEETGHQAREEAGIIPKHG